MKAAISLFAVLLTLSCPSLAQTAPAQTAPAQTAPVQETAPAQPAAPTQPVVPAQQATQPTPPAEQAAPAQTAPPAEQAAPTQPTPPTQPLTQSTAAGGESSQPDAASQAATPSPAPAASPASSEAAAIPDAAPAAPAVPSAPALTPGATLFIEPMNGFEQRLAYAMTRKKVPVVLVDDRAKADFVLSGGALVKKAGWLKGWVESAHGKGSISIQDAHTGTEVFAYKFDRANTNTSIDQIYQNWADSCAKRLKKTLKDEVKRDEVATSR